LIYFGGNWMGVVLFVVVGAVVVRSHLPKKARALAQQLPEASSTAPAGQ